MCDPYWNRTLLPIREGMPLVDALEVAKVNGARVDLTMDCYIVYVDNREMFEFIDRDGKVAELHV